MQKQAVATETSATQRLNALSEELTRRVGAIVEESQSPLLAKQNEELAVLKNEIQFWEQSGDICEGTVLYKELPALYAQVENGRFGSQQAVKAVLDIVHE